MQFDQPLPFYMAYPYLLTIEPGRDQERDLQVMRSYYSRRAAKIQEKVDRECDRMEYDGSMMFDEYPDKFMMEHLCRKIEKEIIDEEGSEPVQGDGMEGAVNIQASPNCKDCDLRDLIGVILFNEMYRRRCRHRRRRRYF
ncbi:MAG: hypothetical protein EOM40_06430 [Clostridia bacterium]|nr:hypothetical protein [Clostridia bacterium]NCC44709.1 hypothetical protein [Clostridia bacterium]